jgi:hypothetical protein
MQHLMDSFLGECVPFKSFPFLFNRILKSAQHLIFFNLLAIIRAKFRFLAEVSPL